MFTSGLLPTIIDYLPSGRSRQSETPKVRTFRHKEICGCKDELRMPDFGQRDIKYYSEGVKLVSLVGRE